MDPIRRIASLGSQLSSSFANRAPHRDAAPFLYPICSPLFYAYGYFRGISGHWKGLPLDFPSFRAPAGFSALFEHSQGTEIRKKIHKKQCVGLLVSSTTRPALFCCPVNSNRAFSVRTLRSMAGYNGITGTAKKGTRSFARFAEYTAGWESGRGPQKQ